MRGRPTPGCVVVVADLGTASFGWWADDGQCGTAPWASPRAHAATPLALSTALGSWLASGTLVSLGLEAPTWSEVPNQWVTGFGPRTQEPSSRSWLAGPGAAARGALALVLPRVLAEAGGIAGAPVLATIDPAAFFNAPKGPASPQLLFWEAFVSSGQGWWQHPGPAPDVCCRPKNERLRSHRLDAWRAVQAFHYEMRAWNNAVPWAAQQAKLAPWSPQKNTAIENQVVRIAESVRNRGRSMFRFPPGDGDQPCLVVRAGK